MNFYHNICPTTPRCWTYVLYDSLEFLNLYKCHEQFYHGFHPRLLRFSSFRANKTGIDFWSIPVLFSQPSEGSKPSEGLLFLILSQIILQVQNKRNICWVGFIEHCINFFIKRAGIPVFQTSHFEVKRAFQFVVDTHKRPKMCPSQLCTHCVHNLFFRKKVRTAYTMFEFFVTPTLAILLGKQNR